MAHLYRQHGPHEGQHGAYEGQHGAHKRQHGAAPCYKWLDETLIQGASSVGLLSLEGAVMPVLMQTAGIQLQTFSKS